MHNGFLKNTLCAYFEGPLAYFPEILNQRVRMETFSIKLNFYELRIESISSV